MKFGIRADKCGVLNFDRALYDEDDDKAYFRSKSELRSEIVVKKDDLMQVKAAEQIEWMQWNEMKCGCLPAFHSQQQV